MKSKRAALKVSNDILLSSSDVTATKRFEPFTSLHYNSGHPPSAKIGLVKGEAIGLLRTNSSKSSFEENISNFITSFLARGYPHNLTEKVLSQIEFPP